MSGVSVASVEGCEATVRRGDLVVAEVRRSSVSVGAGYRESRYYELGRVVSATRDGWARKVAFSEYAWDHRYGDDVRATAMRDPMMASQYAKRSMLERVWAIPGRPASIPGVELGRSWESKEEARAELRGALA